MVTGELKGDKLILTIDVSGTPYVSKSAIAKAIKDKVDPERLVAQAVATSGGFMRFGKFKASVNVNLA